MKTSLDRLSERKRRELGFAVELIRDGFTFATARRTLPRVKEGRLLKIILFGSYARGDWVEDPVGRYYSDYDLLVVVDQEELVDPDIWRNTRDRLLDELSRGERLRTEVSFIVHSLDDVNDQLERGRYFFIDILREGIVLFEEPGHPFAEPQPLSPATALEETQAYFEEWFGSASYWIKRSRNSISDGELNFAAFDLHQATERLYHCLLLVRTLYSPKLHNLNRLRSLTEDREPRLRDVWPAGSKFHRRCFELLREAYVKSRYSPHYRITAEELEWLGTRVELLQAIVRDSCEERIDELSSPAK